MPQEQTTGRKVAATVLNGTAGIEAFLIISSIDIELLKSKKIRKQLLYQIPEPSSFCSAFDEDGIESAKALAANSKTIPPCVWWLDNRSHFEQQLEGIYERLKCSTRPYDAYDYGQYGVFAWINLWLG